MAFDGLATKTIVDDCNTLLSEGRIEKALQPEKDEIILIIRSRGMNHRLLFSASANCARMHFTTLQKENPNIPPVFCMLLRKHLVGGKVDSFRHLDYDRIIELKVLTTNDFGESCVRYLVIEIMGRHSNIILLNEDRKILDSIKHIDFDTSRVREVMPGRQYILPPAQDKISPALLLEDPSLIAALFQLPSEAEALLARKEMRIDKFLLESIKGISPLLAREICFRAGVDNTLRFNMLLPEQATALVVAVAETLRDCCESADRTAYVFYQDAGMSQPFDFYFTDMQQYVWKQAFPSFSEALEHFYVSKDHKERMQQKTADMTKAITTHMDRVLRKIGLQQAALREAENRDQYQLFGELLTANMYQIKEGSASVRVMNYYSETLDEIEIPLDPSKSVSHNAQQYFKKYNKAKSTFQNATRQLAESQEEFSYLESVMEMLHQAKDNAEVTAIREELVQGGYIKARAVKGRSGKGGKNGPALAPRKFIATDGTEILIGRNNRQNDELTLKFAANSDYWLHTKNIPGSHVIVRAKGQPVSTDTLIEAAQYAAFFSKASDSDNVPVDYTQVRHVHKPQGAKPGMVIYENQKTLYVTPKQDAAGN